MEFSNDDIRKLWLKLNDIQNAINNISKRFDFIKFNVSSFPVIVNLNIPTAKYYRIIDIFLSPIRASGTSMSITTNFISVQPIYQKIAVFETNPGTNHSLHISADKSIIANNITFIKPVIFNNCNNMYLPDNSARIEIIPTNATTLTSTNVSVFFEIYE